METASRAFFDTPATLSSRVSPVLCLGPDLTISPDIAETPAPGVSCPLIPALEPDLVPSASVSCGYRHQCEISGRWPCCYSSTPQINSFLSAGWDFNPRPYPAFQAPNSGEAIAFPVQVARVATRLRELAAVVRFPVPLFACG